MIRSVLAVLLLSVLFTACSTNNVTADNSLGKYFDSAGVKGAFGLYDNGQGHFTIYNLARFRDSAYPPGATFDVLQALIALQTGAAPNDTSAMFKGPVGYFENVDPALASRIRKDTAGAGRGPGISLNTIFKGNMGETGSILLANAIGDDTLKKWVDSLRYGNKDISEYTNPGHSTGRLAITADEQLGLTKKLYFDQLPFFQHTQKLVRQMFLTEENSNYRLTYKTGKTTQTNGKTISWIMGWEEENKHPYFFVLNMETQNDQMDVSAIGLQLVKNILGPMGFFAGKK